MRGEAAAKFERFFADNYPLVLRTARLRVSDPQTAEDLTVEAFALAFQNWDETETFELQWVYVILRNLIGDEYRRLRRRKEHEVEFTLDAAPAIAGAEVAELRTFVNALPELEREVVVLRYWADLNSSEIGRLLGCGANTVRVRLLRGRKRLRSLIAGDLVVPDRDLPPASGGDEE